MLENFSPKLISVSLLTKDNVPPYRYSYGKRISEDWELELILDGTGEIMTDKQSLRTTPGRLFIRHPNMELEGFAPYYSYFIIFKDDSRTLEEIVFPPFLDHMEYLLEEFKTLRRNFIQPDAVGVLELKGALFRILAAVLRSQKQEFPLSIQQSERYIREHLSEEFSVSWLAEQAGYSLNHYTRLFKEATGQTPVDFIRNCRVRRACERLGETDDTVEKIAQDCGFTNLSYFFRAFKAVQNQTPGQYRKTTRFYSVPERPERNV